MKRSCWTKLALSFGLALFAVPARADDNVVLQPRHDPGMTAQNFALELRFALYQPQVDSDPQLHGSAPFARTFSGQTGYEGAVELDWQAVHIAHLGSLGPGLSIGYYNISGLADLANSNTPSSESTTLEILPIYVVGVFRLDFLWRELGVPLVPYAKAGLGYALWRASNTVGTSQAPNGVVGEGHTWGSQLAVGLGIDLNFLDRRTSQGFDNATGVNHTYLFGELMRADLSGIAQAHPLYVGDFTWMSGVAFEF
jgi:hypothetical protein